MDAFPECAGDERGNWMLSLWYVWAKLPLCEYGYVGVCPMCPSDPFPKQFCQIRVKRKKDDS